MKIDQKGFTLVELMIVLAIISIIATIAIPQYFDYIKQAKIKACQANFNIAVSYVKSELIKISGGGTATTDVISELNSGGKYDPYQSEVPAFSDQVNAENNTCVTAISAKNLNKPGAGAKITITPGKAWIDASPQKNKAKAIDIIVE